MDRMDETVALLEELIAFPTVSLSDNLDLVERLDTALTAAGARTEIQTDETGRRGNLFATIGPDVGGGIVLSGHTDVVPAEDQEWSAPPYAMTERDGRLYGRGACDMKGFVAAATALAPEFAAADLKRPVHFAFTYDEETGCFGAQALMELLAERPHLPSVCIVGEPTEMRVIEGHKGCFEYRVAFTGMEGHGSAPDLGVSAVEYAVRYVARLLELREDLKVRVPAGSRFEPPWSTLQVGRIEGGVARNVIAGRCELDWEMRPVVEADARYVKREIGTYVDEVLRPAMRLVAPEADIRTETVAEVVGFEPVSDSEAVRIVSELTGANGADVVSFGTEAGLYQALGVSTVVCGPGSIEQAHKPDEFVSRDQLAQAIAMMRGLIPRLEAEAPS